MLASIRYTAVLIPLSLVWASGCAKQAQPEDPATESVEAAQEPAPSLEGEGSASLTGANLPKVGDRYLQRFSQHGEVTAYLLEEKVVARRAVSSIILYRISRESEVGELELLSEFRVEVADGSEDVVFAQKKIEGSYQSVSLDEFSEALSALTIIPDANRGKLSEKGEICLVEGEEFSCERQKFSVSVGGQNATMVMARAQELGRPVSGEIVALDGTILYESELIEAERAGSIEAEESASASR